MIRVPTICIYCGCGCGLYLNVRDGKVNGVTPQRSHPLNSGTLCAKGWSIPELLRGYGRLTSPLIKEKGSFIKASWDKALGKVSDELNELIKKYGPDSIGLFSSAKATNEENYLMMKFARAAIGTNNIDHCARLCHASTVTGLVKTFGSGAMTNSQNEFEDAKAILLTGSNPTEQHPMVGAKIRRAVEKGAKLIVVDPRKIPLTEFAHIHLRQKPGSDVAWINGMIRIIIEQGWADDDFIRKRTENFENLALSVSSYTASMVEEITGIPGDLLYRAAEVYAKSGSGMIAYGMGITQHVTGTDNVSALSNLAMVAGQAGRPSTGVNPLRGQNNVQGACDMGALPNFLTGYQRIENREVREKFEKIWNVKLPESKGMTITEMIDGAYSGKIKGLIVMGENPLLSDPDINHVKKALEKLELLVVVELFMSETASIANVVLPSASFAEKDGTYTNTDRAIQRIRKAVLPVGESMADWEIICNLSERMGFEMGYEKPEEVMTEIASLTPIYGGVSYSRLEGESYLQWPCPDKSHPGTPYLYQKEFTRGKGFFTPVEYREPDEVTDSEFPFVLVTGRIYYHWHTGTMTRKVETLDREVPVGYVEINPADAAKIKIRDRESVKLISRRGELVTQALVTERVQEGVVFMPFHFKEAAANLLTNPAVDREAKIPEFKVCSVKLEKV
ncbi:MAG: formate dehydrogenase subunit alpha [Candidatus Schekmanbacteria bacterium RBG_16_38_11]|uniref:Formate dehydrogenase subunit alpha n=1 Tax=Candidatus Schekmanbacteria bacterium RBG_16_38_11 TaxID=1817880 RepID=A0A1F7RYI5_9BACT|nr:MAG: formate dehydrogenase subunit alpha [Candidatus Schekmanbacteria bacterium RBG_16_38_11]